MGPLSLNLPPLLAAGVPVMTWELADLPQSDIQEEDGTEVPPKGMAFSFSETHCSGLWPVVAYLMHLRVRTEFFPRQVYFPHTVPSLKMGIITCPYFCSNRPLPPDSKSCMVVEFLLRIKKAEFRTRPTLVLETKPASHVYAY